MSDAAAQKSNFMTRLATFIVDKRNLFFLLTIILLIFSAFSRNWVKVENQLTAFLPDSSETKQALDVMEDQFITYGTAEVMVENVTYGEAQRLYDLVAGVKGVQSVSFDNTTDHYSAASALYSVTFDYDEEDDECLTALDAVKETLSGYDLYISTDLGNTLQETIASEVSIIMVYVAVIVVVVLLFTCQTYGEVPVLLLTFVIAMILNQGSNFLLGTISFVSNSVTSILQLALSLDYAVILSNHFREEHQTLPVREAAIASLSRAIPEICASSLTTIGGLAAMLFMQFKIGPDMGICLIKAILYALLSVFIVMPGLLVLFGPLIEKTEHKSFVPKISFIGRFDYKTRFVIPVIFVALVAGGIYFSGKCPYAYGYSNLTTPKLNATQIAENKIKDSLLRRDSTLNTVSSAMKEIMASGFSVNGKTMYLSDFGIETLGYFTAADNEKNAYHINGDADDDNVKSKTNTLQEMISTDPDSVVSFFTQLGKSMNAKLKSLRGRTEFSSINTVYDDKKMKEEYDNYTTKIKEAEKKLQDYEDKWYKKFSAMETALAKLQSNSSAVTSLLGGS